MADLQSAALATWLRRRELMGINGCNLGNIYRSVKPSGLIFFPTLSQRKSGKSWKKTRDRLRGEPVSGGQLRASDDHGFGHGTIGRSSWPAILKAIGETVDIGGDLFARHGLMQLVLWRIDVERRPHWFRSIVPASLLGPGSLSRSRRRIGRESLVDRLCFSF